MVPPPVRECPELAPGDLYLVVEDGIVTPADVPDGWGVLVRRGAELELVQPPGLNPTTLEERVALVERIAAVAGPRALPA